MKRILPPLDYATRRSMAKALGVTPKPPADHGWSAFDEPTYPGRPYLATVNGQRVIKRGK